MKLEEIYEMWESDSQIDPLKISTESIMIPKLQSRYMRICSNERLLLKKLEADYKIFYRLKYDWFLGVLDKQTLLEHGWSQNPRNIIRQDIAMHIESDAEIIKLTLKIAYQKEKVTALEDILKTLTQRTFHIKNYIEFEKWKSGER